MAVGDRESLQLIAPVGLDGKGHHITLAGVAAIGLHGAVLAIQHIDIEARGQGILHGEGTGLEGDVVVIRRQALGGDGIAAAGLAVLLAVAAGEGELFR